MKVIPRYKPISEPAALAVALEFMNFQALAREHPGQLVKSHGVSGGHYDHSAGRQYHDRVELTSMPDGKFLAAGSWHDIKLNAAGGDGGGPLPKEAHDLQTRRNDSPHKRPIALPIALDFAPEKDGFTVVGGLAWRKFGVTRTILHQDGNPRQIAWSDGEGFVGRRGFKLDWKLQQGEEDLVPSGNAKGSMTRKYLGEWVEDPVRIKIQVTKPESDVLGTTQTVILRAELPKISVLNVADVTVCDKRPAPDKASGR